MRDETQCEIELDRSLVQEQQKALLLCIEDVGEELSDRTLEDLSLLLVSCRCTREGQRIIPTLSLLKRAGEECRLVDSLEDLLLFITAHGPKAEIPQPPPRFWEQLYQYAKGKEFQILAHSESTSSGISVFFIGCFTGNITQHSTEKAKTRLLDISQRAVNVVRNSLNLINYSMDRTLNDWSTLLSRLRPRNLQLQSVDEAIVTVCEFIESEYNIQCSIFQFEPRKDEWQPYSADASLTDLAFADLLNRLMKRLDSHKPLYGRHKQKYYLFVPFGSVRAKTFVQYVLFLVNDDPMPSYLPQNLARFIDYYFNEALQQERLSILSGLNRETLQIPGQSPDIFASPAFHPIKAMYTFASSTFRCVLRVSNVFAITMRIFDPSVRGLRLLVEEVDFRMNKLESGTRLDVIPLKDKAKSLNARTFVKLGEQSSPQRRPILSPHSSYNRRFEAASEICYNLHFKSQRVGTVNFEYPMFKGYEFEEGFLDAIVSSLESHLTMLLEFSDKHWLTRRAQYEQNVHEAINVISNSRLSKKDQMQISDYLRRGLLVDQGTPRMLGEATKYVREYLAKKEQSGPYDMSDLEQCCRCEISDPEIKVDAYWLGLVNIILKNLLENFFKYCIHNRDFLTVRHGKGDDYITIKLFGSIPFPEDVLLYGTFRPLPSPNFDEVKPERKGLLLVGILTRQLGGFVHLANSTEKSRCTLFITIPLSQETAQ